MARSDQFDFPSGRTISGLAAMTARVLVTGATGFIGRHSLVPLRELGFDVHVVGRRPPDDPTVTFHSGDLFDRDPVTRIVREVKASHLLHLAWDTEPGRFWNSPLNLDWVGASLATLRAFVEAGGKRAVMAGTCAEYRWGGDQPLDEKRSELAPSTLYGVSKDALRRVVFAYAETTSVSVAWGRVFFLYGPEEKTGRLVSDAIRSLGSGQAFATTDGRQLRDFMHVEDVARAFTALLASDISGAVNIGTGEAVAVRSVLEAIARETGAHGLLRLGARPRPADDPHVIEAASDRLRHEVGFTPRYAIVEGIAQSVQWWWEHGCKL
jgi:nucleoside-diphosphate-sugar epimerase